MMHIIAVVMAMTVAVAPVTVSSLMLAVNIGDGDGNGFEFGVVGDDGFVVEVIYKCLLDLRVPTRFTCAHSIYVCPLDCKCAH